MRDRPELVLAAMVGIAVVVLGAFALLDRRDEAFTLGVTPGGVAAELRSGDRACQERINVSEDFTAVEFQVGTFRREGAPIEVTIRERNARGRRLAGGSLRGGYPDVSRQRVDVGPIDAERQVAVCFEAAGKRKIALYGNAAVAAPLSPLRVNGREANADLMLVFHQSDERSLLAEAPDMFRRAALFKAGWAGAWTFWLLAVAVVAVVPVLLALGLRSLRRDTGA